ncbi:hypothetical protein [Cohnella caldifontis]|uniref:hypothetical protein n=1 Tax=Cohnella caldifontis TaxID=3027471 RepID=UPI0023EDCDC5|nr:hypothetical protein [Cohnella sp. YIM B05605]
MRGYAKAMKGALMGAALTGGWLAADLLLPEPWGDYLLFSALAVVNIGIGWHLGRLHEKLDRSVHEPQPAEIAEIRKQAARSRT